LIVFRDDGSDERVGLPGAIITLALAGLVFAAVVAMRPRVAEVVDDEWLRHICSSVHRSAAAHVRVLAVPDTSWTCRRLLIVERTVLFGSHE
jgi:hypothetical protein